MILVRRFESGFFFGLNCKRRNRLDRGQDGGTAAAYICFKHASIITIIVVVMCEAADTR